MALKIYDTLKPQGDYPAVKAEDVQMPDGKKLSELEIPVDSGEAPVFDLSALGMAAVPLSGGFSALETDTTEIAAALDQGSAAFVVPIDADGTAIDATIVTNGASANGTYQCITIVNYTGEPGMITVLVSTNQVAVFYGLLSTQVGIPSVTDADNGKILQVVDGTWTAVAVADSAVATYVEEYINSALEGDY